MILQRFEAPITIACFFPLNLKTDDVLFQSQSRIVSVLEQVVQVQTKTKNMQIFILEVVLCTINLVRIIYKFLESLEDTRIEGTLPPGSQTRHQEPALVPSYLPKGKQIQHGLRVQPVDVGLDSLQQ